jgi:hypothetical protein
MRHLRNLILFRAINRADWVNGQIEYGRMGMLRASSWEGFAFSGFYLMLFAFTTSWFILGGAIACFLLGVKHRRFASKLQTGPARASQSPQQPDPAGTSRNFSGNSTSRELSNSGQDAFGVCSLAPAWLGNAFHLKNQNSPRRKSHVLFRTKH